MFKEITVTLPIGKNHDSTMEFDVDLDVATEKAIDVYTDKRHYEDLLALNIFTRPRVGNNTGIIFQIIIHQSAHKLGCSFFASDIFKTPFVQFSG